MSKTTVIHHSADYDGIFCREIARKFLPDAELIGWDFADQPLSIPEGQIYILDLPVDRVFGFKWDKEIVESKLRFGHTNIIWIDHHASSIASHPPSIPGYRIDGVAACRLAWAYFNQADCSVCKGNGFVDVEKYDKVEQDNCGFCSSTGKAPLPPKQDFIDRQVSEPLAVRLAGEYDVWDKRDPDAEVFQFGLRSRELTSDDWEEMLRTEEPGDIVLLELIRDGKLLQRYQQSTDASVVNHRSFLVEFEGLKFLALNTARCNSLTFAAKDVPETGHDALMGFYFNGSKWTVSMYHAAHRKELDLSQIAVKHGGGGHRGACGFTAHHLPFLP